MFRKHTKNQKQKNLFYLMEIKKSKHYNKFSLLSYDKIKTS